MKLACRFCKRKYLANPQPERSGVNIMSGQSLRISSGNRMHISSSQSLTEYCPNCRNSLESTLDSPQSQNPATVMLFGAGASAGSTKVNAPPIGYQLFDALTYFDPIGWGTIPAQLQTNFKKDFERGMIALANSNDNKLPPLQRAMAEFFFKYKPEKDSLYLQFCKRLKAKGLSIGLATLNYERLLELAMAESGLDVEVCLPHGRCNIFCDGASTDSLGADFPGMGVTTNGLIYSINDAAQFKYKITHDSFPPVMSYFEPNKRVTSGANFIIGQKQKWVNLCNAANEIYIVGIKPRASDSHIWGPLEKTQAKIIYCSGKNGAKEFEEWSRSVNRSSENLILKGCFQNEFENICTLMGI